MILKEENTKTYQKGYDKCKEDVLKLIDEISCEKWMLGWIEELKARIKGEKE